jgi:5-methylcytosine-specific restriction protein A
MDIHFFHFWRTIMSKIQCSHPACRVIINKQVDGLRCPLHKHKRDAPRKVLDHQRTISGTMIYSTKRWKVLSKKKLTVNPFCEECWDDKRDVAADVVDHVIEIQDDKSKAYTFSNLKSLCHACHNRKTAVVASGRKETARAKKLGLFII